MNRMSRSRVPVLAAATLLVGAVAVTAVAWAGAARPAPPALREAIARLDLSTAQVQELKTILRSHAPELEAEATALLAARDRLFAAVHANPADERAIRSAASAVGAAEGNLAVTRAHVVAEARGVLTPEQQAEAQEMAQEARARLEELVRYLLDRASGAVV